MDPGVEEAPPSTPDVIAPLPVVGESPGLPDGVGPLAEPGTTTGGTGTGDPFPPAFGVLPLGGLVPPPLLGGELGEKVG